MAEAEDVDEDLIEAADDAGELVEKFMDIADGNTRLAIMGAITILLATMALDAETAGISLDHFVARVTGALRKAVAAKKEMDGREPLQ